MKKILMTALMALSTTAFAANHEVKMLDNGKDGGMVFEPGFLKAEVGDTVTFKPTHKGHWVQSRAVPEGVDKFLSKEDEEFTLTLTKEGVYVYVCPPHRMMNMSGIIQVGNPVNKDAAQAEVDKLEKRATENKGRLAEYMAQVK